MAAWTSARTESSTAAEVSDVTSDAGLLGDAVDLLGFFGELSGKASGSSPRRLMRAMMSSHPWSGHHSCGLARADFSRLRLPLRKKSSCSRLSAPSPSSILMVIWNDSISLCFSKSPRQVKLYTSYVSASTTLRRRCSNALSFFDVSRVR